MLYGANSRHGVCVNIVRINDRYQRIIRNGQVLLQLVRIKGKIKGRPGFDPVLFVDPVGVQVVL